MGITGSNGKTIVKEWVSYLAGFDFSVCKNPKSYNSQVGVPLSVLGLNEKPIGFFGFIYDRIRHYKKEE